MEKRESRLRDLFRATEAQDLAEYGIGLAVLGSGAAAIAFMIRADVVALWAEAARFLMKFAAIVGGG
jgi:hypothetical protein